MCLLKSSAPLCVTNIQSFAGDRFNSSDMYSQALNPENKGAKAVGNFIYG